MRAIDVWRCVIMTIMRASEAEVGLLRGKGDVCEAGSRVSVMWCILAVRLCVASISRLHPFSLAHHQYYQYAFRLLVGLQVSIVSDNQCLVISFRLLLVHSRWDPLSSRIIYWVVDWIHFFGAPR